jgi:hypothetical protein
VLNLTLLEIYILSLLKPYVLIKFKMNLKNSILLILSLIFVSCTALKAQKEKNWKKIGSASFENGDFNVVLGTTYNVIQTEQYGEIHLKHKYIDSLDVQKKGEANFVATFRKSKDASIEINNLKTKTRSASGDFKINLKGVTLPESSVNIVLDNKKLPKNEINLIKTYFLPVIHDYLANLLTQFQNNNCISKATRACGKGNVDYIDVNIFATSCAFGCQ